MADAGDLKSPGATRVGSTPTSPITHERALECCLMRMWLCAEQRPGETIQA